MSEIVKLCPKLVGFEDKKTYPDNIGIIRVPFFHKCVKEACIAYYAQDKHCCEYDEKVVVESEEE